MSQASRIGWYETGEWLALCPRCNGPIHKDNLPCPNCLKNMIIYRREIHEVGSHKSEVWKQWYENWLVCTHDRQYIKSFACPHCEEAAVPMARTWAYLERRGQGRKRFWTGLLTAFAVFLVISAPLLLEPANRRPDGEFHPMLGVAAVAGIVAGVWTAHLMKKIWGSTWTSFED